MNLQDICNGCSRHIATCVCCTSIGADGFTVNHPRPIDLAGKLRYLANTAHQIESAARSVSPETLLLHKIELAAKNGLLRLTVPHSDLDISQEQAEVLISSLSRQGLEIFSSAISESSALFISWEKS